MSVKIVCEISFFIRQPLVDTYTNGGAVVVETVLQIDRVENNRISLVLKSLSYLERV